MSDIINLVVIKKEQRAVCVAAKMETEAKEAYQNSLEQLLPELENQFHLLTDVLKMAAL